jgi:hypothetical protein
LLIIGKNMQTIGTKWHRGKLRHQKSAVHQGERLPIFDSFHLSKSLENLYKIMLTKRFQLDRVRFTYIYVDSSTKRFVNEQKKRE